MEPGKQKSTYRFRCLKGQRVRDLQGAERDSVEFVSKQDSEQKQQNPLCYDVGKTVLQLLLYSVLAAIELFFY